MYICYNRTMMTYYETMLQFKENVLESDKFINDNILGKFYKTKTQKGNRRDYKNKEGGWMTHLQDSTVHTLHQILKLWIYLNIMLIGMKNFGL